MKSKALFGMAAACVCIGLAGFALVLNGMVRAEVPDAPPIGSKVPSFTMKDYAGKEHSLEEHKDKIVVLSFTSQECPYSRAAEPIYAKLSEEYKDKDVVFLSIDSNKSTSPEAIKEYAMAKNETGKKLPYPILKDEQNKFADTMGAKRTPEIYIRGMDGNLVYHGAIDNQKKTDDPKYVNYLKNALDEILAGKTVSTPEKSAYGCTIKRVQS